MSTTFFNPSDPSTNKLWSKELYRETRKKTVATKFIGATSDSLIQILDDTQKHPGDKITYTLRMQLAGAGVLGFGVLEGAEEAMTFYTNALLIDNLRHAVKLQGSVSQQRVPWDLLNEAKMALSDWYGSRYDVALLNHLGGNSAQSSGLYTGNNSPLAPDAAHQLFAGTALDEATLTSTMTFTLSLIDQCVATAKTLTPAIRPVRLKNGEYYVMFLHPFQVQALRKSTTAGDWKDIQKAAMQGGQIEDNPIFTGALGMFNGVILHEDARVPYGDSTQNTLHTDLGAAAAGTTSVARAVFCGAQAAVIAFGRNYNWPTRYKWVTQADDYEDQVGVAVGSVWGATKSVFNGTDFATLVASTWAQLS
jgi:N4-gp56 family major capsid protein